MKVSTVAATLLGLSLTSYAYAQEVDIAPADPAAAVDEPGLANAETPPSPQAVNALLTHNSANTPSSPSSSSSSSNDDIRTVNVKLILDPANGGDLASGPRPLGLNIALQPVTDATRKYNAALSTLTNPTNSANPADQADVDVDADVLRSGASDFRGKALWVRGGLVRGTEPGVLCKIVATGGELGRRLPFEGEEALPVAAVGVVCAETRALLEEAEGAEVPADAIA